LRTLRDLRDNGLANRSVATAELSELGCEKAALVALAITMIAMIAEIADRWLDPDGVSRV
jgi:hypothetical protein